MLVGVGKDDGDGEELTQTHPCVSGCVCLFVCVREMSGVRPMVGEKQPSSLQTVG